MFFQMLEPVSRNLCSILPTFLTGQKHKFSSWQAVLHHACTSQLTLLPPVHPILRSPVESLPETEDSTRCEGI